MASCSITFHVRRFTLHGSKTASLNILRDMLMLSDIVRVDQ